VVEIMEEEEAALEVVEIGIMLQIDRMGRLGHMG
jgi:hypothetical protein